MTEHDFETVVSGHRVYRECKKCGISEQFTLVWQHPDKCEGDETSVAEHFGEDKMVQAWQFMIVGGR